MPHALAVLLASATWAAQNPPNRPALPPPDHANVSYGPHERNVLDFWTASSARSTPLVIYYHGGGFRQGDKRTISGDLLKGLLAAGISVAAANYRLSGTDIFPAQMHDCARALQFLRLNAGRFHIDPTRVGATGGSAGAGISMWLGFHDDLAKPDSPDPVLRQSSRVQAAVVYAAQASYDPRFISKLFDSAQIHPALISLYGMQSPADVTNPKFHPLFEEASPITHVTRGDSPVLAYYPQASDPLPPGSSGERHIHHPKFGVVLKEKLDQYGIDCVILLREQHPSPPTEKYIQFFREKFGMKGR
ncbi:MAG: alpha/beta hydrolase [Acidobacteria bacterium]|nr:alpha/beta hydrolase [Acidobacteriota bacterium]